MEMTKSFVLYKVPQFRVECISGHKWLLTPRIYTKSRKRIKKVHPLKRKVFAKKILGSKDY